MKSPIQSCLISFRIISELARARNNLARNHQQGYVLSLGRAESLHLAYREEV